jgi:hypothetical protein
MLIFLQQTNVTRVAHSSIPKAANIMILVALIQIVEIGLGNRKWPIFFFTPSLQKFTFAAFSSLFGHFFEGCKQGSDECMTH